MAVLRIQDFSGIVPVTGDRALPDNYATKSVNTWLYGSELRGLRPPAQLEVMEPTTKKVMRIPKRTPGVLGAGYPPNYVPPPSYLGDSVFVRFTDPDTDIVRGQLVNDQYERWYFCSPTTGPVFNTYARLQSGGSMYKLGVPGPDTSSTTTNTPTIASITGGAPPVVTRAYLYTWANEFGEESSPSLPVLGSGNANAVWNIAGIDDPAANPPTADHPLYTKKYLYRTITGTSGQTTYYRIGEVPLGTFTYADDTSVMTDAILAQNLRLESTNWATPPNNVLNPKDCLQGFVAMANGFLVGFTGNRILMSEPYRFHAWPAEYEQATEYPIVGLGVVGQTCVVATQGFPVTATGTHPAVISFTKSTVNEPCLSRGSIVTAPNGVIYASQNGLIMISSGGIQNVTQQLITREDWGREFAPFILRAARYQNGYLALRDWPNQPNSMFFLDPTALKVALTEISEDDDEPVFNATNVFPDIWSGNVFYLTEAVSPAPATLMVWDPISADPDAVTPVPNTGLMPTIWRSKEFQYPFEENFGSYAIYWDEARYSTADFGTAIMPTTERVRFRVYCNRQLRYDQVVPKNGRPVRLPSGFKGDIWQFEILCRAPVYVMHVASTAKELKGA